MVETPTPLPRWLAASLLALSLSPTWAAEAPTVANDPALEARMMVVASELRCLVCQNQTIADSHADLAVDLRQQIREQLAAGQTEDQVREFMTARYGDFVLYPPALQRPHRPAVAGPGRAAGGQPGGAGAGAAPAQPPGR